MKILSISSNQQGSIAARQNSFSGQVKIRVPKKEMSLKNFGQIFETEHSLEDPFESYKKTFQQKLASGEIKLKKTKRVLSSEQIKKAYSKMLEDKFYIFWEQDC